MEHHQLVELLMTKLDQFEDSPEGDLVLGRRVVSELMDPQTRAELAALYVAGEAQRVRRRRARATETAHDRYETDPTPDPYWSSYQSYHQSLPELERAVELQRATLPRSGVCAACRTIIEDVAWHSGIVAWGEAPLNWRWTNEMNLDGEFVAGWYADRRTHREVARQHSDKSLGWHKRLRSEMYERRNQQLVAVQKREFQKVVDSGDARSRLYRDPGDAGKNTYYDLCGNRRDRQKFRDWLGPRFQEWYDRLIRAVENGKFGDDGFMSNPDFIASDWHEGGVHEYFAEKQVSHFLELAGAWVEEAKRETRLEVTRELLETVFALGDGTRVSWGDATVEQHQQRVKLLVKNVAANAETAARHALAIDLITQASVGTLRECSPDNGESVYQTTA